MVRRRWILDTETTSLTPSYGDPNEALRLPAVRHCAFGSGVIWELALSDPDSGERHLWRMQPALDEGAQAQALDVGGYYERTRRMTFRDMREHDLAGRDLSRAQAWTAPRILAPVVARLLAGTSVICAVPTFDRPYVQAFLAAYNQALTCHYRMRDFGSMAYGYLLGLADDGSKYISMPEMDAGTDDFARALSVDPCKFERHSALGDCLLLAACLDVIEGGTLNAPAREAEIRPERDR